MEASENNIILVVCKNRFIRKIRIKLSILSFKYVQIRGSLARNARFGVSNSEDGRLFSNLARPTQYFRGVLISACRFRLAGAAFSVHSFCICVTGAVFCDVAKVESKIVPGIIFVIFWKNYKKIAKIIFFFPPVTKWIYKQNSQEIVAFHLQSARWTSF